MESLVNHERQMILKELDTIQAAGNDSNPINNASDFNDERNTGQGDVAVKTPTASITPSSNKKPKEEKAEGKERLLGKLRAPQEVVGQVPDTVEPAEMYKGESRETQPELEPLWHLPFENINHTGTTRVGHLHRDVATPSVSINKDALIAKRRVEAHEKDMATQAAKTHARGQPESDPPATEGVNFTAAIDTSNPDNVAVGQGSWLSVLRNWLKNL